MSHSDMSTSPQDSALQEDISAIEEKRQVLAQIVEITKAIEHMQESLESILLLGVSSKVMPEGALNLYTALSDSLRNLSTNKIKDYLQNMEMIIKNQLEKILHYSGMDFSTDEAIEILYVSSDSSEETPLELLEAFKRTAQTAVSLRVLLRKRGVASPGAPLPVPQDVIVKQMARLDAQEQQQRAKIKDKIVEMKDDISSMIENPDYPESMKKLLVGVQDNLDKDLHNIQSGGELSRLSFVTDAHEIPSIQAPPEKEEIEQPSSNQNDEMGLYKAANSWLNSPWDVTWKDIKKTG